MVTDPIFERYRTQVWPFFWPVFAIAILLFHRQAKALVAKGCIRIDYHISPLGLITIRNVIYPGAPAGWKDQLFSATGAYGADARAARPVIPGWPAPGSEPEDRESLIIALNWIIRPRAEPARLIHVPAHETANLPLPHT